MLASSAVIVVPARLSVPDISSIVAESSLGMLASANAATSVYRPLVTCAAASVFTVKSSAGPIRPLPPPGDCSPPSAPEARAAVSRMFDACRSRSSARNRVAHRGGHAGFGDADGDGLQRRCGWSARPAS